MVFGADLVLCTNMLRGGIQLLYEYDAGDTESNLVHADDWEGKMLCLPSDVGLLHLDFARLDCEHCLANLLSEARNARHAVYNFHASDIQSVDWN